MKFFTIKKVHLLNIVLFLFILFINSACKKFVQITPPINQIVTSEVFANNQTATSAMVGLYSKIMGQSNIFLNGATSIYTGLSADEIKNSAPGGDDEFSSNSITIGNAILDSYFWAKAYSYIYQINSCIEGFNASTVISPATKQQLLGEAKFMRALCYFYLINLFGDMPLVTSSDFKNNTIIPRTPTSQVYQQIISDLYDSQNLLPSSYTGTGKTRPNKWAATTLLARVYLYQKNWAGADSAATAVISSSAYRLTSLDSVFLTNSNESIWQLASVNPNINTTEGNSFVPINGNIPNYPITPYLFNAFETNDQRKIHWVKSTTVSSTVYYYPNKYKIATTPANVEANTVLRLAELYLIRSEARAQENNTSGAQDDLNLIRTRASLPNTTSTTQSDLLTAIYHERQVELFTEFGHRWLDLKRTATIDAILSAEKPGWSATAALYPVPMIEIQYNISLIQNPGY